MKEASSDDEDIGLIRRKPATKRARKIIEDSDSEELQPPPKANANKRKRAIAELDSDKEPTPVKPSAAVNKRRKVGESSTRKKAADSSSNFTNEIEEQKESKLKPAVVTRAERAANKAAAVVQPKGKGNIKSKAEFASSDSLSINESDLLNAVSDEAPQYLDGLCFVVSGVFENITRDKVETFILDHGGRRTGSVSGKTDYLLVGHKMEDGREVTQGGKYRGAEKKGITILTEETFEELV